MYKLITGTTAYSTFANDASSDRLSHAYMLHLSDGKNLRSALKIFALRFFGFTADGVDGKRLLNENMLDCRIYPDEGKKLTAEVVSAILGDCAMRPVERDKKLYIISGFNEASPLLQNKLLKTLEEPPRGVYFLLGATTLAPVLETVKSRVKTLTIPPFSEREIYLALERKGSNPLNGQAAKSCGGIFGEAENMVGGGWFSEVQKAAMEICTVTDVGEVGEVAIKYGEIKHKNELLAEMALNYRTALGERARGQALGKVAKLWQTATLIYALESVDKAGADIKFNAFFQGLLYDLMLRIIEENNKWLKLRA